MIFFHLKGKCFRFTLIELLVVIGIIAILATILFPVVHSVRENSKVPVCLSNLRQIALMHINYANSNDDKMCPAYDSNYCQWDSSGDYREAGLLVKGTDETADATSDEVFACPSLGMLDTSDGYFPKYAGYGYNMLMSFTEKNKRRTVCLSEIKIPNQIVLVADAACYYADKIAPTSFLYPPSTHTGGYIDFRHNGKACVSYADGHADTAEKFYPAGGNFNDEAKERLGYLYSDNTPYEPRPRENRD